MCHYTQCLCDLEILTRERVTFLQQLIGFAPLGCGFALTAECPEVSDQVELPSIVVPDAFTTEGIPEVLPIAGGGNETTWEILSPPAPATIATTTPTTTTTTIVDESTGKALITVVDGEQEQLFNLITCGEYLDMAPEACGGVRLSARVSTFELTACCAFLHAAHARGCLCPPVGFFRLNAVNPDLSVIAPAACALRLDSPPPLGLNSCKTKLTLEQVMSPAQEIVASTSETGEAISGSEEAAGGEGEGGGEAEGVAAAAVVGSPKFFDARNITLGSLADVAEEATPILVTTATTLTVVEQGGGGDGDGGGDGGGGDVVRNFTIASEHEIPLGSVIGVVSEETFTIMEENNEIEETLTVEPFAVLQPGATYAIPSGAIITTNVTSASGASGSTTVTVGGDDDDTVFVVTVPDLNGTVQIPWVASLTPVPLIEEANYDEDVTGQLPVAVVTHQVTGITSLIPLAESEDASAEEIKAEIAAAEGGASVDAGGGVHSGGGSGGGDGLIYGASDDTGLGDAVPSSTTSCLFAVIIAEASCIPMLESVEEVFELDLGWRVCCARIRKVDDDRCFCDGAVAAALDVSARSAIHERIMDAIPGACDFQVTTGDSCPTALFTPAVFDPEDDAVVTAVAVTTANGDNGDGGDGGDGSNASTTSTTTLVSVDAEVYALEEVVSSVTAAGGVVVSTVNSTRQSPDPKLEPVASIETVDPAVFDTTRAVTSIVASTAPTLIPTVVLTPQTMTIGGEDGDGDGDYTNTAGGVSLTGDGVVSYESGALPGVTVKVGAAV